jgi:hypothetical protein
VPVPTIGTTALNNALSAHTVCVLPAFATDGLASRVIVTVLSEGVQTPLEIVHLNI